MVVVFDLEVFSVFAEIDFLAPYRMILLLDYTAIQQYISQYQKLTLSLSKLRIVIQE